MALTSRRSRARLLTLLLTTTITSVSKAFVRFPPSHILSHGQGNSDESTQICRRSGSSSSSSSSSSSGSNGSSNDCDTLAARRIAHDVLMESGLGFLASGEDGSAPQGGRSLEVALSAHPGLGHLSARDRAFVRLLVATAERRQGQIDRVLASFMDRYPPSNPHGADDGSRKKKKGRQQRRGGGPKRGGRGGKAGPLQASLRLGAAQLLFLDTEPFAAVDSSVEL